MAFFSAVGRFFEKVFTTAPQWTIIASTAVKFAAPAALGLMQVIDPKDAPEAMNIAGEVNSDLALAGTMLSQMHSGSDPSKLAQIRTALTSVNSNMGALLQGGHVKNPDTLSKIDAISTIVTGEVNAVLGALPAAASAAA